jgi:putative tryptophan/tyrosine transport system substrate-binding protein
MLVAGGLAALSLSGVAQASEKVSLIGYLSQLSEGEDAGNLGAFRRGLSALGYVEGKNAVIEARYANGKLERLPELAAEIVRLKVDVIVAAPTPAVRAAQQATRSIPIVMAYVGDPVGDGFVSSLARPGGNVTGLSSASSEMAAKRVEFLNAVIPGLSQVALLAPPQSLGTVVTETVAAGHALGVRVVTMPVRNADEVDRAFAAMPGARVQGVVANLSLRQFNSQIVKLALANRLPSISSERQFVAMGGLMAYGPHYLDLSRRAATYADRILKGAKPAELPVEQPTKFELIINLKTARALELTIPSSLRARRRTH